MCGCGDRGRGGETKREGGRCCCGLKSSFFPAVFQNETLEYKCSIFFFFFAWLAGLSQSYQSQELEMFSQFTKKSEESIWEYCLLKLEIIYHS